MSTASTSIRHAALEAVDAGLCVVPPKEDGTKAPDGPWKQYQSKPSTVDDLRRWYGTEGPPRRTGMGLVCGAASGNLEVMEFDAAGEAYPEFKAAAVVLGLGDLVEQIEAGCLDQSPSGGIHWHYRCGKIAGNTKLASRVQSDEKNPGKTVTVVLIETRGEGGYIITAPSHGTVHPSGLPYKRLRGSFQSIATITPEEREAIWNLARSFDRMPTPQHHALAESNVSREQSGGWEDVVSPIDDFNARANWHDVMPTGWETVYRKGDTDFLRRPGKDQGVSATINHNGSDLFYVFSSSTEFEPNRAYSKFGAYALIHHGGDHKAAALALMRDGYGTVKVWVKEDAGWNLQVVPNPCPSGGKHRIARPGEPPPDTSTSKIGRKHSPGPNGRQHEGPLPEPTVNRRDEGHRDDRPRVQIEISTDRHEALEKTLANLGNVAGLFTQGNVLVTIAEPEDDDEAKLPGGATLRKTRGTILVAPIAEAGLSCLLTSVIEFFSWGKDKNGEEIARPVHPPAWLVQAVLQHGVYSRVRPLTGIMEIPFPRPDGSLVTEPGYDPVTGFYYSPSIEIESIPDDPSQDDAKAAANELLAVVRDFPFSSDDDKAVWLAGAVTVVARPAINGPTPGFAYNGNRAGTGKGKAIDSISTIATGRPVPTTSCPVDNAEAEKLKVSFALAATQIIHLDNLTEGSQYGGGVLDSALTSTAVGGRILGSSKTVAGILLRAIWFLSGNNITPTKDAFRRWLVCNLVTPFERPEERTDITVGDLLSYVREHRARLVRAVLIILRAHAAAGRPTNGQPPLGSFESWDEIVRGAVWFAIGRDCCATRRKAADDSPDRLNKLALLEAWMNLVDGGPGESGVTSAEAHRLAFGRIGEPPECPDLAEILLRFSRRDRMTPSALGYILRGIKDQTIGGMTLREHPKKDKHSIRWYVEKNDPDYPNDPDSGVTGGGEVFSGAHGAHEGDVFNQRHAHAEHQSNVNMYDVRSAHNGTGLETSPSCAPCAPGPTSRVSAVQNGDGRERWTL